MKRSDHTFASSLWSGLASPKEVGDWAESVGRDPLEAMWPWFWAEDGFWSISTTHTFASALMCTKCSGVGDLIFPARAIRFTVPSGLLTTRFSDYRLAYLMVMSGTDKTVATLWLGEEEEFGWEEGTSRRRPRRFGICTVKDPIGMLTDEEAVFGHPYGEEQVSADAENADVQSMLLARRMIVGLLYTFQHSRNWEERRHHTQPVRGIGREPPDHRNIVIGSPLKYDSRPQVRSWLLGGDPHKHGAPSLQHIVRGHYKRQVIGEGRSLRKVIWVEPYWRGPEGAPILIRERRIEG